MQNSFRLIREEHVDEINTWARLYRHERTGAQVLSLENDDENKVFGITFRTPPPDSTGVAHILEHAVLGGSQKYPLKEPFVQLLKGSLYTFLNAMTFPDRTVYPVASQNLQDFHNLVDVYLDAVLHPIISPQHLQQEGWHYELENVDAPLQYKGVVFNEMKGAYSSPDSVLYRTSRRSLFPDTVYGFDSGGDPQEIPQLTYEQFEQFHATYYHPANALIYFYGDDNPEQRLALLDSYLGEFEAFEVDGGVKLQPAFTAPRRVEQAFGVEAGSDSATKGLVQVNWLLSETDDKVGDQTLTMLLSLLSYAMVGTQASPLRKRLVDSGLGEDLTGGGLSTGLRQLTFHVGLRGVDPADAEAVEHLILDTLAELAETGIDRATVEAAYNTFEFSLRENNTGSYPRGLSLMMRALRTWLYTDDPLVALAFEEPLRAVRQCLDQQDDVLQKLIREHLLDNTHRTTVILRPDPEFNRRLEADERAQLDSIAASLNLNQRQDIVNLTLELQQRQAAVDPPELLATLPTLKLADLEPEIKTIPIVVEELDQAQILYHDLFTNGIVYVDVGFDLHSVPQDLLPYAQLFSRALVEMGTEKEDYVKLSQRIGRHTGGVSPGYFLSAKRGDPDGCAWLMVHGKSTVEQAGELLAIVDDILRMVKLDDRERFKQIALKAKAGKESALVPSGHTVVDKRLRAGFSTIGWVQEQLNGTDQLLFLRQLLDDIENAWPTVLEKLEQVKQALVNQNGMLCNITLDEENWHTIRPQVHAFLQQLPHASVETTTWRPASAPGHEGLAMPAQVNYVGKGANLFDLGYELDGSIDVITNYLRTGYLWDKIRVQGGAYGAFNRFSKHSGVLTFLSYRDPNLLGTLDVYDQAADFLRKADVNQDELTRSIIGAIGKLDAYQLPDAKGYTSMVRHLVGEDDETRQTYRDQVLGTTTADFRRFANILDKVREVGNVVVLGSPDALAKADAARDGWLDIRRIL